MDTHVRMQMHMYHANLIVYTRTLMQAMNKDRAMKILKGKLLLIAEEQKAKSIAEIKGDKVRFSFAVCVCVYVCVYVCIFCGGTDGKE